MLINQMIQLMNITIHITAQSKKSKIKPVNVKLFTYVDSFVENNDKDHKFKVCDHARIQKYKITFVNSYIPNCSEQFFGIEKVKNTVPWTNVISGQNGEKFV